MSERRRILAVHATPVAVDPTERAFRAGWGDVELVNLLDDRLSSARSEEGDLTEPVIERLVHLVQHAEVIRAHGVLVTCSAFGPAIERAAALTSVPVVKPNESMFRAALDYGETIGMLATFAPAVDTMSAEFEEETDRLHKTAHLRTALVRGAGTRLRDGDGPAHDRMIAEQVADLADCDAVMLAHFSTARAKPLVQARTAVPVLSAPETAVSRLKDLVTSRQPNLPSRS